MAYKCVNKECKNFDKVVTPGGKLIFKNDKLVFTGSKCRQCNKEMKEELAPMGNFKTIVNTGDGRNL